MPSQIPTSIPRYSFMDDYSEGAHPALLKALITSNTTQETGYGGDTYCDLARQRIRRHLGRDDVGIFFVPSGTSANAISIAACLRPHEAVIAASSGHILTPETIERALDDNWHFPHMAKPRLVYISNATEIGTIYSRAELAAIKQVCEKNGLILFLDGARIGTALASKANDMTLSDILELTDIFWIGGTKNGALLGEAVVVKDARLSSEFEFYVKQHGSLLAKGRVIGAQFAELFEDDLYFELARKANLAAESLSSGIAQGGFSVYAATETNQVFAVLPLSMIKVLKESFSFYVWEKRGDDEAVIRLLTTWATEAAQVERFLKYLDDVDQHQDSITVKHSAYWCYCGPLLDPGSSLPDNLYDFESQVFTHSIRSGLDPFLNYIKNVLLDKGFKHYFLTIRATRPTREFDQPRWHTDELFFTTDILPGTRLGLKSHQKHHQPTGTDFKICTTLLGPSTLFIPGSHQPHARKAQESARDAASTENECVSIRCVGCAAAADAVRDELATVLEPFGAEAAEIGECSVFKVGREFGASIFAS
ncbi:threonine aldolase [Fusarium coicis]|nr:threonine aldolase [Fusarium coicis]